jgi:hypothetical protein
MSTLEKLSAHEKRWNIEIDDQAAFVTFKNRILQELEEQVNSWGMDFWNAFPKSFNYFLGRVAINQSYTHASEQFLNTLRSSKNSKELAHYFQLSFIAIEHSINYQRKNNREYQVKDWETVAKALFGAFSRSLRFTPQIGIEITESNEQVIIYPKGARLLDEAVINQNLVWLESHPDALKCFEQALTQHMAGDKSQQRNLLDNLRFALEQLLKDILGNEKSLQNQKEKLLPWLEVRGVHKQTVNMYNALLFGPYSQFQNDAVKHGKREEEFTENDIEFMIYLTGTFMRLLLQLEQSDHITKS